MKLRWAGAHRGGALRNGGLAQHGAASRALALGGHPRPSGRVRDQALLCTDLDADPERIISWFVRRWQMEATFQEARQRLGFETQRQWSEWAIRRSAPALLALFSLVTLFAHQQMSKGASPVRRDAWYDKPHPTFSDALALVRRELWAQETFCGSACETDTVKVPRQFVEKLTDALCYAA